MPKLEFSTPSSDASARANVFDPEMPILRTLFDANRIRDELRPCLLSLLHAGRSSVGPVKFQVLQWRPGRRLVLEIVLQTTTRWLRLVGKVYRENRPDVFEAIEKIWQSGLNREAEFSISRPIAYLPGLHLLLEEKVEGIPAKRLLLDGNASQRAAAAERCALWLVRFQALAPLQGKVMRVRKVLEQSERRVRSIFDAGAPFADKAERLFRRLSDIPSYLEKRPMCAGHGDYTHNQVILSDQATVTIDWDSYGVADPCRDVARFLVCLERLAMKELRAARGLEHACNVFVRSYLTADAPGVESHLPFYKAALYLQVARRDVVSQDPWQLWRAEIMLNRALQAVAA
jgi:hypothetical protein